MKLKPTEGIPLPECDPIPDWSAFSHGFSGHSHYLAYAVRRDFLSTPRSFAIIEFCSLAKTLITMQQMKLTDFLKENSYLTEPPDSVLYHVDNNSQEKTLVFLINDWVLKYNNASFTLVETLYHCVDSKEAMMEFLDNIATGANQFVTINDN